MKTRITPALGVLLVLALLVGGLAWFAGSRGFTGFRWAERIRSRAASRAAVSVPVGAPVGVGVSVELLVSVIVVNPSAVR